MHITVLEHLEHAAARQPAEAAAGDHNCVRN